jgi:radical SAM protein with 4Fe4S-binding SPASM domain
MITNKLRKFLTVLQMIFDLRMIKMFFKVHQDFSRDKNYKLFNLIKALLLVSKHEKILKHEKNYIVTSFIPPLGSKAYRQIFKAVLGKKSSFYEHTNAIRTAPISIFIAVTEKCNYNCWHCSKANRKQESELSLKTLKKTIQDLQEMGTSIIGLTGGEPMLRKDLIEIVKSIDERSTSFLYTTGQGLTQSKAKQLKKAGLFAAGISLDHYQEKVFDGLRGYKGAYQIALKAIENCKKAGLYTMIQTVATPKALANGDLLKMIALAKDLKVQEIRILETMPSGKLIKIDQKKILNAKQREKLIKIHQKANQVSNNPKVTTFAQIESPNLFGCGAGTQHSYLDAAGNLYPCDFVPMAFGNLKDQPIQTLWQEMNRQIQKPRDRCLILEAQNQICKKAQTGGLPIKKSLSKEICKDLRKMKKLPKFYRLLKGEE